MGTTIIQIPLHLLTGRTICAFLLVLLAGLGTTPLFLVFKIAHLTPMQTAILADAFCSALEQKGYSQMGLLGDAFLNAQPIPMETNKIGHALQTAHLLYLATNWILEISAFNNALLHSLPM